MAAQTQSTGSHKPRWYQTRQALRTVRLVISYVMLIAGALFMLFPLIWMFSTSLKPEWQIFAHPIIWIPQEWHQQEAGETGRTFGLWKTQHEGKSEYVISVGVRKYSSVVDVENIRHLYSIPETAVSEPSPVEIEGALLSIRTTTIEGEEREVVALTRDGDNLVVVDMADLDELASLSQPALRGAEKAEVVIGGIPLEASIVSIDGVERRVILIGGEKSFATVIAPDALESAWLVRSERLRPVGLRPVGQSELKVFELVENGSTLQVVSLADERWQPIVDYRVAIRAFSVAPDALVGVPEMRFFGGAELQVQRLWNAEGEEQEVAILKRETDTVLVIDLAYLDDAQIARMDELAEPRAEIIGGTEMLVKDDFEDLSGRVRRVVCVGDARQMATVVPFEAMSGAYDVPEESLKRYSTPHLRWENYVEALSQQMGGANFLIFFRNTAILEVLNIVGTLFSCTIVAYGFARLRAPGKTILFIILLSTMMLPFAVTLVPFYEIFVRMGEFTERVGMFRIGQDTLWPLFVTSFFGDAFFIFLLRQFFMTIPTELEDAARIDGASRLQTLWYVMVPLLKPALATVAIFTFMGVWNAFLGPLIFLNSPRNFTVTLGLNFFRSQYVIHYPWMMAVATVSMLPMLLLFFFAQRLFIEGITLTGLKG